MSGMTRQRAQVVSLWPSYITVLVVASPNDMLFGVHQNTSQMQTPFLIA